MSIYFNNPWKPLKNQIIKDSGLANKILDKGYELQPFLNKTAVDDLLNIFQESHNMDDEKGGMFYSVYSQDLLYRKKVHQQIGAIIEPLLSAHFQDFKVMINSFVVKISGPESEFYLHQDTTGLDEHKYSPLNLWIPLIDVNEENGCLGIIEKSHKFFSPYRSISFPAPFDEIQSTVKQYLKPVEMKAGEALIFDNRVLHHSYKNESGKTRIAVVCGLFPKEAELITCHKPEYKCGGEVELIKHEDEFLLKHPKFLINCQDRPNSGTSLGTVEDPYLPISEEDFEKLCALNDCEKNESNIEIANTNCNLIGEPLTEKQQKLSILERIKNIF